MDLSGNVYVADIGNLRIQKFDSQGNFLDKWGSSGTSDGQFIWPYGVAVDLSRNVYVADRGNLRIQKFDSNGNFITKWGNMGVEEGQFINPLGVAVDSAGNVYVADTGNHRIQKFSLVNPNLPVNPNLTINPTQIDFSTVIVGTNSDSIVTIRNDGDGDLIIGTITSPLPPFSKLTDNCSGQTLAPQGTCAVTIRFSPNAGGNFNGNFNIPSNDPNKSTVTISLSGTGEDFVLSMPLNNTSFNICSLYSLPAFSWSVGNIFRSLELQFSSDQNFSSISVKARVAGTTTEMVISSNLWKKVLSIPGIEGGTVYWRVVGTRADRTTVISDIRSIIIEPAQPVANPSISPTNKSLLPQLSWQNNCNTKFRVWFGSDNNFSKKMGFTFNVKNPSDNGGVFQKTLTPGQWTAVRKLVGNITGSPISWYVESWDGLGRHNQTDVMSFSLME